MANKIKVGINGFGRIGRKVLRLALERNDIEIVGINDLSPAETQAHLLKYDSVHGKLSHEMRLEGNTLMVKDQKIRLTAERDPTKLNWSSIGANFVHECTGVFRSKEKAALHQTAGAKKVIISAPGKDEDITICMGVNHESYDFKNHYIVSNASCTTNCLAPVAKVLDDAFGIEKGNMITVHSYTNDQSILDLPHEDLRRARAAAVSQIPTTTGAAKAVGLVLPHLKGKLDGTSVRVPTPNVSMVYLNAIVKTKTTADEVNKKFQEAAKSERFKNILGYCTEELVSCDYMGNTFSSTIDAPNTKVLDGNLVTVMSWYDNESGFSERMLDLTSWMAKAEK